MYSQLRRILHVHNALRCQCVDVEAPVRASFQRTAREVRQRSVRDRDKAQVDIVPATCLGGHTVIHGPG